jgi:putative FmdB family regulatory protein
MKPIRPQFASDGAASRVSGADYHGPVPIYEFVCGACGERFEELVRAGTESVDCRKCGHPGALRVPSAPAETPRLTKTARQDRRLEDARGVSRDGARQRFKERRRKEREARARRGGGEAK